MANVKIENFSGDTIIAFFDSEKIEIRDEERISVEATAKGTHEILIHRARIPMETENFHESEGTSFAERTEKAEKSQHVQLDGRFTVNINSTKAVLTVKTKVRAKEKFGIDAVFSGYALEVSGAKIEKERQIFSGKKAKQKFLSHQLKEAIFPVGGGGILVLILGLIALYSNIIGKTVNIGGRDFTYPWSIILVCLGLGFVGYTTFVIINIIKNAKKYTE